MRAMQKLIRHGNSTGISIPRVILVNLGWLPGQAILVEEMEDKSLRVRQPRASDFGPMAMPNVHDDTLGKVNA